MALPSMEAPSNLQRARIEHKDRGKAICSLSVEMRELPCPTLGHWHSGFWSFWTQIGTYTINLSGLRLRLNYAHHQLSPFSTVHTDTACGTSWLWLPCKPIPRINLCLHISIYVVLVLFLWITQTRTLIYTTTVTKSRIFTLYFIDTLPEILLLYYFSYIAVFWLNNLCSSLHLTTNF